MKSFSKSSLVTVGLALIFVFLVFIGSTIQSAAAELPKVRVLATGGTIVNIGTDENFSGISGKELIASIPDLAKYARVEVEQIVNLPSSKLTPSVWITIAKRINELFRNDKDLAGVVVTHGSDTLEETAYFLNLTVRSDKPVVVTGSMIKRKYPDSDGVRNLLSAVQVAANPAARGKGTMIVFNKNILASRVASKTHTVRVDAFSAGEMGTLGVVDDDGIWFYNVPAKRHTINSEFDISAAKTLPEVGIVYSYAGAGGGDIEGLANRGVKGIVIAGTGSGGTSPGNIEAAKAAEAKGVFFVSTTRVREGRVLDDDIDVGLHGDNLSPQKCRILLMLALAKTKDPKEIQRFFDEY